MRKTHIRIGGAYRRNPEREVRLIRFTNGGGRGGMEVPNFEQEPQGDFGQQMRLLTQLLEMMAADPKIQRELRENPRSREAFVQFGQTVERVRQRFGQVEQHAGFREVSRDSLGQEYVADAGARHGAAIAREHGYQNMHSLEARGRHLGTANAMHDFGGHAHEVLDIHEGMTEEEMFTVVEKARRIMEDKQAQVREMRARREQEWICGQRPLCPRGYILSYAGRQRIANARRAFMEVIYPEIKRTGVMKAVADYKRVSDKFYHLVGVRFVDYRGARESLAETSHVVVRAPDGQVVGSINPATGEGAYPPELKAQMLEWATLPGVTRGNVTYVTVYPGDDFMEKHPTADEQAGFFRNGRRENPYTVASRGRRALQNTMWAREYSPSAVNARPTDPIQHLRNVYEAYFKTSPAYYARYRSIMGQVEGRPNRLAWAQGKLHELYQEWDQARSQGRIRIPPTLPQEHAAGQGGGDFPSLQTGSVRASTRGAERNRTRIESVEFADLKDHPNYEPVMRVLNDHKNDPYYLAWARSQFEAMRKSQRQLDAMREAVPGEAIKVLKFPIHGEMRDADVGIVVPKEYRLEGEDGIIGIHDPRAWAKGPFGHSRGETYAHDAGIRVEKILNADESVRGMQVEFTKPGVFYVNGRRVAVGQEGEAETQDQDFETIQRRAKGHLDASFGNRRPRELWITKDNEQPFTVDPTPATAGNPIFVQEGIVVARKPGPNYDYVVLFTKPGHYELSGILRDGYYKGHPAFPKKTIDIPDR